MHLPYSAATESAFVEPLRESLNCALLQVMVSRLVTNRWAAASSLVSVARYFSVSRCGCCDLLLDSLPATKSPSGRVLLAASEGDAPLAADAETFELPVQLPSVKVPSPPQLLPLVYLRLDVSASTRM
jgi:hypothetical protein